MGESADFSDLKDLRGDLLSRVHNITREYLVTQPHQSDIHSLRRDLNATRLMVGELGTDLDERPTHADLAKMKLAVWNTTRDFLEKDYLSVNKALLSMSAQQVSGEGSQDGRDHLLDQGGRHRGDAVEAGGQNPHGLGGIDGRQQDQHKRAVQRLRLALIKGAGCGV